MSDIFREVDEALQREKAEKFWNEYGATLILAAVLMVIGTAAGVMWRTWDHSRDQQETARLFTAINSDDPAQLETVIADSRAGHEAVALFAAADMLRNQGDLAGAAAHYRAAAENRGVPRDFRDLARILYVRTAGNVGIEDARAILKPALDNKKSPFLWQARIEAALAEAHAGHYAAAQQVLAPFTGPDASALPLSLAERGRALHGLYAVKAAQATGDNDAKDAQ